MSNSKSSFSDLGLSEQILKAVKAKGFEQPTTIQELTIPKLLEGENDIIAQSQTGTGKTAAFGLPILQLLEPAKQSVQSIVLVPTRELAIQVTEELLSYNKDRKLSIAPIYGGASMSEQLRRLARGIDIVVGTPGRTLDHIRRGTLDLSNVRFLVLDEADEMLNMGFLEDVEQIINQTPKHRRVLLFSATMPNRIVKLSQTYMRNVEILKVDVKQITPDLTDQIYFEVRESDKFDALTRIIDITPEFYGIVFCRTRVGVDQVASRLSERGYSVEAIHGEVSQGQREKTLQKFRNKQANILIATDVAARGIDINNLTHVINYSLPQDSDSYVHRVGRTGRAGNHGTAITFLSSSEMRQFGWIKRDIKLDIEKKTLPTAQDVVAMKRARIQDELQEIVASDSFDSYGDMAEEILNSHQPHVAIAALLKLAFRNELDESNYPEIGSFSVDRKGTARLFISVGKVDGYDSRKLAELVKRECGLSDNSINDIKLLDTYSFVSVPFADAEHVVHKLNKINTGSRPLAEIAKPPTGGSGGGGGGERRERGRDGAAGRGVGSRRGGGRRKGQGDGESRSSDNSRRRRGERDGENRGGRSREEQAKPKGRAPKSTKSNDGGKKGGEFDWSMFEPKSSNWGESKASNKKGGRRAKRKN